MFWVMIILLLALMYFNGWKIFLISSPMLAGALTILFQPLLRIHGDIFYLFRFYTNTNGTITKAPKLRSLENR